MTAAAAPRFNSQKGGFLDKINKLETNGVNLLKKLKGKEKMKDLKIEIDNFVGGVNLLVTEFNDIKENFANLAGMISSDVDDGKNKNANFWKGKFNEDHNKGIFEWMHEQILDLLKTRWNKLNLDNDNGPNAPNYTKAEFQNYKEIIQRQNEIKTRISNSREQQFIRMQESIRRLSEVSKKVSKPANQPGPSQP